MDGLLLEDFIAESEEENISAETERDDLKQLLLEANLKVTMLEDQLSTAQSEIKFLREELSSTQVDLIKSRSEVKVLLEEVGAYKTQKQSGEEFPNLLLSSLDKLFEDKQQQLWLISGIQNNIDKLDTKIEEEIKSIDSKSRSRKLELEPETNKSMENQISHEANVVPKLKQFQIEGAGSSTNGKKDSVTLHLELKKAYDFSPPSEKRSHPTPSSLYSNRNSSFWTPTTPTPSHALRPSLSLHNLESKTFTEVLIPTIKPPEKHEVSPQEPSPSRSSPRVVKFSPSFNEKVVPRRSYSVSDKNGLQSFQRQPLVPTVISPPGCVFRQIKNGKFQPKSPPSKSPSPQAQHYKSFTALGRLSNISENVIFMECS